MRPAAGALLAATVLAALLKLTCSELVMVYSVQRHGARNVLPKTALLGEDGLVGGPTLLPEGQRQTYDAGKEYK